MATIQHFKNHLVRCVPVVAIATLVCVVVHASRDAEHEALAHLAHEITLLERLIESAEREKNPDARIQFRYDWLRRDLTKVKRGIEDHLQDSNLEPRTFAPLNGAYSQ